MAHSTETKFQPAYPANSWSGTPYLSDPDYQQHILKNILKHGVICLSKLNFEPDDLELLMRRLGNPIRLPDSLKFHKSSINNSTPFVTRISNIDQELGKVIKPCNAAEYWHSDGNYFQGDLRYNCNLLHSQIRPAVGGYTGLIDNVAAYSALNPEMKELCKHVNICVDINTFPEFAISNAKSGDQYKPSYHDLITVHKYSGSTCIYMGSPIATLCWKKSIIDDLNKQNELLKGANISDLKYLQKQLWAHLEKEEFRYVHKYEQGDLLIWDNVLTMHRSMGGYGMHPRKLIRGQIRYE